MTLNLKHYSIRAYAIIIDESGDSVLISDEFQLGIRMTKFPGGGLLFGEGLIDCILREAREELGQNIEIIRHFYTTDFFQKAYFFDDHQLISVYYVAKFCEPVAFKISVKDFDFSPDENGKQSFRWIKIGSLNPEMFTFPIDQVVGEMIKNQLNNNAINN
jgi:8-oxo-dGTP diphosphatase